ENTLPGKIHSLILSKNGGFWLATEKAIGWTAGHLIRFKSGFTEIQAVLTDHDSTLWIASAEGLHFIKMNSTEEIHDPLKGTAFENIFITSLHQAKDQCIWIGTFDQGLLCYNPHNKAIRQFTEHNGLINNNILSLESLGDTLWIASLGGVSKAILSNAGSTIRFESFDQKNDPGANYVYHLFKDSRQRIWLGTDGKGLLYYEKGSFKAAFPDTLRVNSIYSIAESMDGSIWFTASDNGIYHFSEGKLNHLTTENGLSSMTVTSLKNAGDQFLLAVTAGGIDLIHVASQEIYPLSRAYGLGAYQANLNAIGQNEQGDFFIGTLSGLQILTNISQLGNRKARLYLEELQSFGESLTIRPLLKLKARQNQITANYAALWYPQPELLQFEYQLQGYDQNFRLTRERQIHFNALESGYYTLQIKLKNLPSYLEQSVIKQQIKILQPLWKRWYILIPALLLLLTIVIVMLRLRIKKIRKEQLLKRERAEFEYRNLRSQVNPHFLFNSFSTLMALIEENSTDALEYTEQLSDYFRQILQFRDTELISLKEELRLLENYFALQKKRYGEGLKIEIRLDDTALDSLIPPMSLQMLAENALKHNQASRSNPLQIRMYKESNNLVFCNQLQPKQNTEKSIGLGIKNIEERYLNFAAKQIRVVKNNTNFCVYLPLIPK
ncbi:MAG TPA: histidine kinase, partial [Bacteroidales bacterium]|nr:histidine kinase [Bacteroidales bacterium]